MHSGNNAHTLLCVLAIKIAETLGEASLSYRVFYHLEVEAQFLSWWVASNPQFLQGGESRGVSRCVQI